MIHAVAAAFVVFVVCLVFEGCCDLFVDVGGGIERIGAVWDLIVTRVAGNEFGPTGGEHIALALRELTGLQTLNLAGA